MLLTRLIYANKPLLLVIALLLAGQFYYNVRFAQLCQYVDHGKPLPHPIAFEAFPFVVYNMYSGKIEDWNKYSYLMIEADGKQVNVTDFAVIVEDQYLNPSGKFLQLRPQEFEEPYLKDYLLSLFGNKHIAYDVYNKASNKNLIANPDVFGRWLKRYLMVQLKRAVNSIKLYNCVYQYTEQGRVQQLSKELVYEL